jgi:hypothetical protein
MGQRMQEVIGLSATDLDGRFEAVRTRESNLGNLVCDVFRTAMGADVVLLNSGSLRWVGGGGGAGGGGLRDSARGQAGWCDGAAGQAGGGKASGGGWGCCFSQGVDSRSAAQGLAAAAIAAITSMHLSSSAQTSRRCLPRRRRSDQVHPAGPITFKDFVSILPMVGHLSNHVYSALPK